MSASKLQFTTCDFGAAAGPVPALLESMSQPPEQNARMPLISITTSLAHVFALESLHQLLENTSLI